MGIDLTLVIDQHGLDPVLAYTRLPLNWRHYDAFDEITELSTPLARCLEEQRLQGWGLAVLSFVQMLPAATKVVLWWS